MLDIIKYLPSAVLPKLIGFLVIPFIVRLFPPNVYGEYSVVMAGISLALALGITGFGSAIIRFLPTQNTDDKKCRFFSTVILFTLFIIGIVICIGIVLLHFFLSSGRYKILENLIDVALLLFGIRSCYALVGCWLRAGREIGSYNILELVSSYGTPLIGLTLVFMLDIGIVSLLWGGIIASLLGMLLVMRRIFDRVRLCISNFDLKIARQIAKFGFFISLGNGFYWFLSLSDRYLIRYFNGSYEVGIYSLSYDVVRAALMLVTGVFELAVGPLAANLWQKGREVTMRFVTTTIRTFLLVSVPAAAGLSVLSKQILEILAPAEYGEGYIIIPFVSFAVVTYGLKDIVATGLILHNRTDLESYCLLIASLINIFLNIWLLPVWGFKWAAITTLLGYLVYFGLVGKTSHRFLPIIFPYKNLVKILVATTFMCCVVFIFLKIPGVNVHKIMRLVISLVIGLTSYLGGILILGEISRSELSNLYRFFRRS